MTTPREHIEEIRRVKFSIGGEENPLTEDLHHAVKHLSAELYTKDVHFLMELIQNAEDNEYPPDVEPTLEFVVTTRDITGVGAPATLLVFNNEKGFSSKNIESLCSVGRSTKKGKRQGGYIGEKGIGFKSVFLVTSQPYIFSNGYKIRFSEIPPSGVKIGYIVPEWIDGQPNIEDIRKTFPVKQRIGVEGRKDIANWVITLAFPRDERVTTSNRVGAGIYAFLPTEMVTGFPFIIQADFLLTSSRESIIWDNKWNQGILDCVPSAFCAAFLSLVKSVRSAPPSARSYCFRYLPISSPSYPQLRRIRKEIQAKLMTEEVILCEPENAYCTPIQARRIDPAFRNILHKATEEGLEKPSALWSTGTFIIYSCMDNSPSLDFLGVAYVTDDWYSSCIQSIPGWLADFSEDLYVQLLCFVADHWNRGVPNSLKQFPLFKFDNCPYGVSWASLSDIFF
ncbi:hypothetical protein KI387_041993, partial [Taxus chinensis]